MLLIVHFGSFWGEGSVLTALARLAPMVFGFVAQLHVISPLHFGGSSFSEEARLGSHRGARSVVGCCRGSTLAAVLFLEVAHIGSFSNGSVVLAGVEIYIF